MVILHKAGELKLDDHCGPFQPRPFYDSMIKDWLTHFHKCLLKMIQHINGILTVKLEVVLFGPKLAFLFDVGYKINLVLV